jgi:hypothetical protein
MHPARTRHAGPPLVYLAGVFVLLSIGGVVAVIAMAGGAHFPSPFEPQATSAAFFIRHRAAVQLGAFLVFGAAVPLGLYTATVTSRLRFLGLRAAGVHIALFGGLAASFFLSMSGLAMWALSQPGVFDAPDLARALHLIAFAAGGPGHVVPLGLLVAGVAVSAALARLLPGWMMAFGLVVAVVAELSTFTLVAPWAAYLLPLARLGAFAWLICAGVLLPDERGDDGG